MNIDEQKNIIRKEIKMLKKALPEEERMTKSKQILSKIELLPQFQEAVTVLLYWSMNDEVYTHDFVQKWSQKKQIILPCVCGNILLLKRFSGIENMSEGTSFSIPEPVGEIFQDVKSIDIAMIPGIAFDKNNNRMGRGKAYYDKLLPSLNTFNLGICFDFQLFENIPSNQYDVKMDMIVEG